MANVSRSWGVILDLQTQLQTIRIANGYLTDAGANIWTTDGQRTEDDALGIMIYSDAIEGPGEDKERSFLQQRDMTALLEAAITTDLDTAQQLMHALIEDIETCLKAYTAAQQVQPANMRTPMHLVRISILDRPEGSAVVAMQAQVAVRYFR